MTAIEYRMLAEVSANAGRAPTYEHLMRIVWEEEPGADMSPMRTMAGKLRAKLGEDARNPRLYLYQNPSGLPDTGGGDGGERQCRVINHEAAGAA